MPIYTFRDKETGEEFEELMSWDERNALLEEHPNLEAIIDSAPALIRGRVDISNGGTSDFRQVLEKVATKHPRTPLSERFGRRSAKDVATQGVIDKHSKKRG